MRKKNPVKSFAYKETVANSHEHYLWGNTAYAFGTRLTDSFAKYRWCPNIVGPQSGARGGLAAASLRKHGRDRDQDSYRGCWCPIAASSSGREGFISLTMRKGSDNAAFFSASSVQKPKFFGTVPKARLRS
ncbi:type VI secretion system contractile sheath large subunit [Pseudomonas paraeruginosa]|uniref:type VI secretion system contractile sheath domain-containing protein n=1 Tax=Pseudomonas paraeruginosa TaxID=2994495 RepID=UPI003D2B6BB2